jgi:hypothetical protein
LSEGPTFSICHTTARPDGWQDSYHAWFDHASRPTRVQYVLCVDRRWGFEKLPDLQHWDKAVWNTGRRCLVDGANIACAAASGQVLIVNSDDMFPGEGWDDMLLAAIGGDNYSLDDEFVVRTFPGEAYQAWLNNFVKQGCDPIISRLMTLQILSRARYQKFGYALYPEFTSMMADTDFTRAAEFDGIVIEAPQILVEHRHPFVTGSAQDDVSKHENQQVAHELGARIYARREMERTGGLMSPAIEAGAEVFNRLGSSGPKPKRKRIAVLNPGDEFSWQWVSAWSNLLPYLANNFDLAFTFESCSNQYFSRDFCYQALLKHIRDTGWGRPDFVLWIDSDNILPVESFRLLLDALEARPDVDAVGGWYWIATAVPQICARVADPDGVVRSVTIEEMQRAYDSLSLLSISDHMGFGSLLMRWGVMESDQTIWPFRAMVDPESLTLERGQDFELWKNDSPMKGDDVSFCRRAIARGHKFYVHPEVYLQHLKRADVQAPRLKLRTVEQEKAMADEIARKQEKAKDDLLVVAN